MTTILNNVPRGTSDSNDSGYGFIIGAIVVIVLVVLLLIYGLPMLLDSQALRTETPIVPANNTTNTSSSTTINIELPSGTTTSN